MRNSTLLEMRKFRILLHCVQVCAVVAWTPSVASETLGALSDGATSASSSYLPSRGSPSTYFSASERLDSTCASWNTLIVTPVPSLNTPGACGIPDNHAGRQNLLFTLYSVFQASRSFVLILGHPGRAYTCQDHETCVYYAKDHWWGCCDFSPERGSPKLQITSCVDYEQLDRCDTSCKMNEKILKW